MWLDRRGRRRALRRGGRRFELAPLSKISDDRDATDAATVVTAADAVEVSQSFGKTAAVLRRSLHLFFRFFFLFSLFFSFFISFFFLLFSFTFFFFCFFLLHPCGTIRPPQTFS